MTKKITFLGIETSCDETAASVIRENDKGTADVLSNIVSSQISEHKKFGGVVPELAARAHIENIEYIIKAALEESKVSLDKNSFKNSGVSKSLLPVKNIRKISKKDMMLNDYCPKIEVNPET